MLGPETLLSRFFAEELAATRIEFETIHVQFQMKETELSKAQEENRKLKETVGKQRDVPGSVLHIPSATPSFVFTDPSHFLVKNSNEITRTDVGKDENNNSLNSSVFLADLFTDGVMSVDFTILSLDEDKGDLYFGLMDSTEPIPVIREQLEDGVDHSVGLNRYGILRFNTPLSQSEQECHSDLKEGDCIRMELNLSSTPRTVQFFLNGEAGMCYASGIPSSVRVKV
ncbi:hypothetical protein BLNAU_20278 [Blattamonas nauphoetae]|uniref:Uncharacterized protein n=1 Tax=Blattamonas nauphoetae TaxID=2049346 RepID=A0ABQ9WZB1_9EUKA|nr:hypothetical protein BLNAU_20278 [Blattamonas nauphoetae]